MKGREIIFAVAMLVASLAATSFMTSCSSAKRMERKSVATLAEDLKRQGFRTSSPVRTIEELLRNCRAKTAENPNLIELTQQASGSSEFAAEMAAELAVASSFSVKTASIMEGKMEGDIGKFDSEAWSTYRGSFTQTLKQMVGPMLKEGLKLTREEEKGVTVWMLFHLDEKQAQDACLKASEKALEMMKGSGTFSTQDMERVQQVVGNLNLNQ